MRVNENEAGCGGLEGLILGLYRAVKSEFVSAGPSDREHLQSLFSLVPGAGKLLAGLVGEDKRPGWERFLDYANSVAATLEKNDGKLVLLIDPAPMLNASQAADWRTLAPDLPSQIRVLIAQRPDDALAADGELRVECRIFPFGRHLGDLNEEAVVEWYRLEIDQGRLKDAAAMWRAESVDSLGTAAYVR